MSKIAQKRKEANELKYKQNPKKCRTCQMPIPYAKRRHKHCCTACDMEDRRQIALRNKIGGSTHQRRSIVLDNGQRITVDSSWEELLAKDFVKNHVLFEKGKKFSLTTGRSYTPDFYLPEYDCYVDPKANVSFFKDRKQQQINIKTFEKEYNCKVFQITNKKHLNWHFVESFIGAK